MSYIIPSPYNEAYEAVAKGLGKYHYDAIVFFADENL
jgi:RimJ/RimL family protein N-acetyltransferase